MNNQLVWRVGIGVCLLAALVGCANPLSSHPDDHGMRIAIERTRRLQPLNLGRFVAQDQAEMTDENMLAIAKERFSRKRFEGLERFELTLEQARAWTLENNLEVRASLISPTIAALRVTEEEAAFEAVFFANFSRTETEQPTASTLVGSQIESTDLDFGVRIPTREGTDITVRLPFNKTETNNPFSILDPSFTSDMSISISQPLLRGGWRQSNTHPIRVASLQRGIEESRTKLEVIRQITALDRAYWNLYAARRALEVAQQQYELAMSQYERAERRVRAGEDAEVETIRAEEGVAQRLEAIVLAENRVRRVQRDLKRIMNIDGLDVGSEIVVVPTTSPDPIRFELDGGSLTETAIANRMELLELELQLAIDASTIALRKNQALPLFSLDFLYNINGLGSSLNQSVDVASEGEFTDWRFGIRAETPIGNEAAISRINQAILSRLQRLSTRESRRLAITQETLDAIDAIDATWQRIMAARQSALLAGRTLAAEQRQFGVGASTSTDVLDAATRLADAQLAEIRALRDYEVAQVDLAFATGTSLGAARVAWEPFERSSETRWHAPGVGE